MKTNYALHPLCTLFPRMTGFDFECLKLDILNNGQREPIILHDGMILDGGNRYLACTQLGITPNTIDYFGDNITAFVLSVNLHRRHLTQGQQAAIVASVQDWGKAQKVGKPNVLPNSTLADTVNQRAEQAKVSVATQRKADAVAKADPELAAQVARGEVSLNDATREVAPQLAPKKKAPPENPTVEESLTVDESYPQVDDNEHIDNLIAQSEDMMSELADLHKIINSDDKLAAAYAEVKRFKEFLKLSTERFNGIQNEKNELIKLIKSRDRKIVELEKKLKKFETEKF